MEVLSDSVLRLNFTGGANSSFMNEHRFSKSLTINQLKNKLEMIMGVGASGMQLQVFSAEDQPLFYITDDEGGDRLLGSYQIDDGMRVNVTGPNLMTNLGNLAEVEKYEMKDNEYDKKRDSVRSFLKKNRKGKYDPEFQKKQKELEAQKVKDEEQFKEQIKVGMRCKVTLPKQLPRRGTVAFVGYTEFKPDLWTGIKLDEPTGKNDGSVEGKKYFQCEPNYGVFARPKFVECGDFPELDIDDDMDEM